MQPSIMREQQNKFVRKYLGCVGFKARAGVGKIEHHAWPQGRAVDANNSCAVTHKSTSALSVVWSHQSCQSNLDGSVIGALRNTPAAEFRCFEPCNKRRGCGRRGRVIGGCLPDLPKSEDPLGIVLG